MASGRIYVTAVRAVGDINLTHQYDVDVRFDIKFDSYGQNQGCPYTITCDGQNQSGSASFYSTGNWVNIGDTKTFRITMPTSGANKTVDFSASITTGVTPPTLSAIGSYTLGAVTWEHTVKYNANGGSGAPDSQIKTYGFVLKLSSVAPAKTGYIFMGWATSTGGSAVYVPGGSYATDADITLYAVWQIAYIKPTISNIVAVRCIEDGTQNNDGTYAKVTGTWAVDTTVNTENKATSLEIEYRSAKTEEWISASNVNPSAASGEINSVIGEGNISLLSVYFVRITVTDSGGNRQEVAIVPGQFRPMDVANEGKSIAFGGAASDDKEGVDFYTEARVHSGLVCNEQYFDVDETPVKVADFVIAHGTSGIWAYRKWNSGIAEAWGISMGTTDVDGIYHASLSHPFPYAENPVIAATAYVAGDNTARIGYVNTSPTSLEFYVHGFANNSACARLYVIGRWK